MVCERIKVEIRRLLLSLEANEFVIKGGTYDAIELNDDGSLGLMKLADQHSKRT